MQKMTPRIDLAVSALLLLVVGAVWVESANIAPPFFDPLGSAAVPRIIATFVGILALILAIRAGYQLSTQRSPIVPGSGRESGRYDVALGMFVLSAVYLISLQKWGPGFQISTIAYVLASAVLLGARDRRSLMIVVAMALFLGVGAYHIFTRFFYIDLPN